MIKFSINRSYSGAGKLNSEERAYNAFRFFKNTLPCSNSKMNTSVDNYTSLRTHNSC